jgi:hypothetical protein
MGDRNLSFGFPDLQKKVTFCLKKRKKKFRSNLQHYLRNFSQESSRLAIFLFQGSLATSARVCRGLYFFVTFFFSLLLKGRSTKKKKKFLKEIIKNGVGIKFIKKGMIFEVHLRNGSRRNSYKIICCRLSKCEILL